MSKEIITKLCRNYKCEIVKNTSIKVTNIENNKNTSFKMFDLAEYDSYNLSYLGHIVGITDKTITIVEEHCFDKWKAIQAGTHVKKDEWDKPRIHRLKLDSFAWRNYDFNLAKTRNENHETSMYI